MFGVCFLEVLVCGACGHSMFSLSFSLWSYLMTYLFWALTLLADSNFYSLVMLIHAIYHNYEILLDFPFKVSCLYSLHTYQAFPLFFAFLFMEHIVSFVLNHSLILISFCSFQFVMVVDACDPQFYCCLDLEVILFISLSIYICVCVCFYGQNLDIVP